MARIHGKTGPPILEVTPVGELEFYAPFFDLLKANDDKDPYLRHAAVMGPTCL